jgi:phosphoserine phosphatase RsbU/P
MATSARTANFNPPAVRELHLRPLLVDPAGVRFLNTDRGMPLGLGFGSFSEVEVRLPERSRLGFYSDGITEAVNPAEEEYGPERREKQVLLPEACADSILEDVRWFADGAGLHDDATVIFVKA